MTATELLSRIHVNPQIFGGKPLIRGLQLVVEPLLGMTAAGDTPERVLQEYPFWSLRISRRAWSFSPH
jgi:uncharacterized protein (DUF433 family)